MKLSVKRGKSSETFTIEFEQVTQLIGTNVIDKNFILDSVRRHFSGSKYADYEADLVDNVEIDGEVPGRKYFTLYSIESRSELISQLKYSKTSIMKEYISDMLLKFDFQKDLSEIERMLIGIFERINSEIIETGGTFELGFEQADVFDYVQESVVTKGELPIEALSTKELLLEFLNTLEKVLQKKGEKTLVLIKDLDHLLTKEDYCEVMEAIRGISKKADLWFIVTSSLPGYVYVSSDIITGINVVNDYTYSCPSVEEITSYLRNNYPKNIELSEEVLTNQLIMALPSVGHDRDSFFYQGQIIAAMLNLSEFGMKPDKSVLSKPEIAYLFEEKVI